MEDLISIRWQYLNPSHIAFVFWHRIREFERGKESALGTAARDLAEPKAMKPRY